jgi:hypothetical protein
MGFLDSVEAGSQIDHYRIESPVARSGMASPSTCATTKWLR